MRANASLLLRLVCSIALLLSALPTRAGVVCVEHGRVLGPCAMASIPERAIEKVAGEDSAAPRMACCRPKASKPKASVRPADSCPTHKGARCAYAYHSGIAAVASSKAPRFDAPLLPAVAILPDLPLELSFAILVGAGGGTFAGDSDPPRFRPRAPDRGRAPPVV